jgi:hypothetical protein
MYNDLLGEKKRKLKSRWSLEIAQDLKDEMISEEFLDEFLDEKETPNLNVKEKWTNQYETPMKRLSTFLLTEFPEHIILSASAVDNAIMLLQRSLEYEQEVCSSCSHKEKLKYLADHDMIKEF